MYIDVCAPKRQSNSTAQIFWGRRRSEYLATKRSVCEYLAAKFEFSKEATLHPRPVRKITRLNLYISGEASRACIRLFVVCICLNSPDGNRMERRTGPRTPPRTISSPGQLELNDTQVLAHHLGLCERPVSISELINTRV